MEDKKNELEILNVREVAELLRSDKRTVERKAKQI